jgi:hypothetical protein
MNHLKALLIAILVGIASFLNAQTTTETVMELNKVLESSLYKTVITVNEKGSLERKDSNGNTFTFDLNDVQELKSDNDGFNNVLIIMKEGKTVKGVVENVKKEASMNVIAFNDAKDCEIAIQLLKKLTGKSK